jgi:Zn-dependent M28 family amino/carboxypeptidase
MTPRLLRVLPFAGLIVLAADSTVQPVSFDAGRYLQHVRHLSSPELKGRGTGSPELEKAAHYIAEQFKAIGLQPVDGKSFLQPFPVTTNARLGKGNRMRYRLDPAGKDLDFSKQAIPFNFSSAGKFTGPLVFAGYGITAKEYGYDDYTHLDVQDKFVVILRHEPQEFDEKSPFNGKVYTEHSQFFSKATNAKLHGARGVILINDTHNHPGDPDELEVFAGAAGPSNAGIPFIHVKTSVAEAWFKKAGKDLAAIQASIAKDLSPQSFPLSDSISIDLTIDLRRDQKTVNNVIGFLPGNSNEHIVIGAHYDHLGLGHQFSMAPSEIGKPHPGADDNASGSAGVIELARYFSSRPRLERGVVFMAFAAEELGLLGSSYYVNHAALPVENAVAMFNMDMIGRIRDGKVYLGGLGTGANFQPMIDELAKGSALRIEMADKTGYGSSDHTSFTTKQVPVLFFFSGLHADYHKPSDTWDKINAAESVKLLDFIASAATKVGNQPERPKFVRVTTSHQPLGAGSSSGGGYGPYFGSIPDFAEPPTGVRFSDVREGSPASKAGLKGGDILVEFDGKKVQNLYDFTYILRTKKPGETVKVTVLRDGKPLEVECTLEKRK